MRPGSALLNLLNSDTNALRRVQFMSIWTPLDLTIIPPSSSRMMLGQERKSWTLAHRLMIWQSSCLRQIEQFLLAASSDQSEIEDKMSRQSDSNRRPADYKSAALPAELCRHLPGKIPSDASSASRFLYAISIRLSLTLLKAWFWIRSEPTRAYSHLFGVPATTHPLRAFTKL